MNRSIILLLLLALSGCGADDLDCPAEDRYIDGYKEITYPSGDVYYQAIWRCPT